MSKSFCSQCLLRNDRGAYDGVHEACTCPDAKLFVGQNVRIKAIEQEAKVRCVQVDVQGITYKVSYWHDCKLHEVWVYPDELEAVK